MKKYCHEIKSKLVILIVLKSTYLKLIFFITFFLGVKITAQNKLDSFHPLVTLDTVHLQLQLGYPPELSRLFNHVYL